MSEQLNENDKLIPVFEGENLIYVTPPEYYAKYLGGICLKITEEK